MTTGILEIRTPSHTDLLSHEGKNPDSELFPGPTGTGICGALWSHLEE